MYAALALKSPGEPNWTAPAFVTLGILGTALWLERAAESVPCAVSPSPPCSSRWR